MPYLCPIDIKNLLIQLVKRNRIMEKHIPPQILRIKRKRGQDPLQALILEDNKSVKRSKPSSPASSTVLDKNSNKNFYFTLTRTDDSTSVNDESVIESILSEATPSAGTNDLASSEYPSKADPTNTRKRKFIIPKKQTEEDTYIPHELADMVSSLLTSNGNAASPRRKRRNRNDNNLEGAIDNEDNPEIQSNTEIEDEKSEYVYDVYQLSSTEPMTTANHPQSQIGYIRFFDEENELYQSDDENNKTDKLVSDDEDSNAESFYQNDYPSDEDAGAYSDTYTEEEIEIVQIHSNQIDNGSEGFEYINSHNMKADEGYEDLYEDFYDGNDDIDFLPDDQYNRDDEDEFERNHFFEGEEDDELAIHRDKIFGKLQKMINEKN